MFEEKRNLSALEYLKVLEDEWWVCNLRKKIYPSKKDKDYYNNSANLKKSRIIEISERNDLPHIFNNKDMMKDLNRKFSSKGGYPTFPKQNENDIRNYFMKNSDVRCFLGFNDEEKPIIKIGKIIDFDINKNIVTVVLEKENQELLCNCVTRIF